MWLIYWSRTSRKVKVCLLSRMASWLPLTLKRLRCHSATNFRLRKCLMISGRSWAFPWRLISHSKTQRTKGPKTNFRSWRIRSNQDISRKNLSRRTSDQDRYSTCQRQQSKTFAKTRGPNSLRKTSESSVKRSPRSSWSNKSFRLKQRQSKLRLWTRQQAWAFKLRQSITACGVTNRICRWCQSNQRARCQLRRKALSAAQSTLSLRIYSKASEIVWFQLKWLCGGDENL